MGRSAATHEVGRWVKGGTWQPAWQDIVLLEASLQQVSSLSPEYGSDHRTISRPLNYLRQYVGVNLDGKRLIYVNAFCADSFPDSMASYWRDHFVEVADGGTCVWKAFYDPTTNKFFSLRINGVG